MRALHPILLLSLIACGGGTADDGSTDTTGPDDGEDTPDTPDTLDSDGGDTDDTQPDDTDPAGPTGLPIEDPSFESADLDPGGFSAVSAADTGATPLLENYRIDTRGGSANVRVFNFGSVSPYGAPDFGGVPLTAPGDGDHGLAIDLLDAGVEVQLWSNDLGAVSAGDVLTFSAALGWPNNSDAAPDVVQLTLRFGEATGVRQRVTLAAKGTLSDHTVTYTVPPTFDGASLRVGVHLRGVISTLAVDNLRATKPTGGAAPTTPAFNADFELPALFEGDFTYDVAGWSPINSGYAGIARHPASIAAAAPSGNQVVELNNSQVLDSTWPIGALADGQRLDVTYKYAARGDLGAASIRLGLVMGASSATGPENTPVPAWTTSTVLCVDTR